MIEAREFRIGSKILVDNEKYLPELNGKILTVIGYQERVDIDFPCSTGVITAKLEDIGKMPHIISQFNEFIKPIPLSEEWLFKANILPSHKLGFRRFYAKGNLSFEICKSNIAVYFKDELLCFIDYVHQLQNLFMCWGEELTFNL